MFGRVSDGPTVVPPHTAGGSVVPRDGVRLPLPFFLKGKADMRILWNLIRPCLFPVFVLLLVAALMAWLSSMGSAAEPKFTVKAAVATTFTVVPIPADQPPCSRACTCGCREGKPCSCGKSRSLPATPTSAPYLPTGQFYGPIRRSSNGGC